MLQYVHTERKLHTSACFKDYAENNLHIIKETKAELVKDNNGRLNAWS